MASLKEFCAHRAFNIFGLSYIETAEFRGRTRREVCHKSCFWLKNRKNAMATTSWMFEP